MKKKFAMLLVIILLLSISINMFAAEENNIVAKIVNPNIFITGTPANNLVDNPIISYNDRTYISIRDLAKFFGCNVLWNERTGSIHVLYESKEDIIKSTTTASQIAIAMLKQNYPLQVTESTKYYTYRADSDMIGGRNTVYITEVVFNGAYSSSDRTQFSNLQFDVVISICAETGSIEIEENVTNTTQDNWFEYSEPIQ